MIIKIALEFTKIIDKNLPVYYMDVARISVGGKRHSAKIYLTKTFENFLKN